MFQCSIMEREYKAFINVKFMIPRDYLDRRVYWGWIRSGFYPESK